MSTTALTLYLAVTDTRDGQTVHHVFDRFPVRIGRHPLNDIVIATPTVSKFHAELDRDGQALVLIDRESRNGTRIDDREIPPNERVGLAPPNEFTVGPLRFHGWRLQPSDERPGDDSGTAALTMSCEEADLHRRLVYEARNHKAAVHADDATAAAEGLKLLAARFVSNTRNLEGSAAILHFLGRMQNALEALAAFYVAHEQQEPTTPRDLLARLLDWSAASSDPARVVEDAGANVAMRHRALLAGVERGVAALLQEFSPAEIEVELRRDPATKDSATDYERRWRLLETRHENLREGLSPFVFVFGPEFAAAYERFRGKARARAPLSAAPPPMETSSDAFFQ